MSARRPRGFGAPFRRGFAVPGGEPSCSWLLWNLASPGRKAAPDTAPPTGHREARHASRAPTGLLSSKAALPRRAHLLAGFSLTLSSIAVLFAGVHCSHPHSRPGPCRALAGTRLPCTEPQCDCRVLTSAAKPDRLLVLASAGAAAGPRRACAEMHRVLPGSHGRCGAATAGSVRCLSAHGRRDACSAAVPIGRRANLGTLLGG